MLCCDPGNTSWRLTWEAMKPRQALQAEAYCARKLCGDQARQVRSDWNGRKQGNHLRSDGTAASYCRGKAAHHHRSREQESTRLALVGAGFFFLPAIMLRDEIRNWSFHNIIPGVARQPYREQPDAVLGAAGENLATILHRMTAEDRASIAQGLRSIVPGFKDLKTAKLPIEDTLAFQIVEDELKAGNQPHLSLGWHGSIACSARPHHLECPQIVAHCHRGAGKRGPSPLGREYRGYAQVCLRADSAYRHDPRTRSARSP